jgi:hypothetical protein
MPAAMPRLDQKDTYQRLATLYTVTFALAAGSFYVSLLSSGIDMNAALFASLAAALHFGLLRLSRSFVVQAPELPTKRYKPAAVLADKDLLNRIEQLTKERRNTRDELGVMLIDLENGRHHEAPPAEVVKLVRGELFRAADSRIFQLDECTLAIVETQLDVVLHFDKIALALHRQLIASQTSAPDSATTATVGVAVAASGAELSPPEMVEQARTAVRLARANGRDTFFRRL